MPSCHRLTSWLFASPSSPLRRNALFTNNSADVSAAAHLMPCQTRLAQCAGQENTLFAADGLQVIDNKASIRGGAIGFPDLPQRIAISNSKFGENEVTGGDGGALDLQDARGNRTITLDNVLFECNWAAQGVRPFTSRCSC